MLGTTPRYKLIVMSDPKTTALRSHSAHRRLGGVGVHKIKPVGQIWRARLVQADMAFVQVMNHWPLPSQQRSQTSLFPNRRWFLHQAVAHADNMAAAAMIALLSICFYHRQNPVL